MFTQMGLSNLWDELKTGKCPMSSDIQIVCDSDEERCMKIYLSSERRYTLFSSRRASNRANSGFSIWVRTNDWQPLGFFFQREAFTAENRLS